MQDERSIRVFVSSTFRDMQLERDELVKRVFPQVRRLCEQRGVSWSEVDLRWGVTDEQKAEGAVLPICLAEIERTRPYFIGLLGQRYGWVPDELPGDLVDELGWLTDDRGRSVTELEIVHGVLNDADAAGHAFFYLRDPAWVDALPVDERATYVEESPDGVRRLAELRERVRASGHPVRDYPDPRALGELVLADLVALVEQRFPDASPPSPLDRVATAHAAFGAARHGIFVDRPALTRRLDELADGDGPPVLVTGPAGAGASALLANWAADRRRRRPDELVLVHHVELDAEAADHRAMVRRLVAELARASGGPSGDGTPGDDKLAGGADDPAALRSELRRAFTAAPRTVLVLDGVDRLDDVDGAPDLRWLPSEVPPHVRVLMAASAERPVAAFAHRGWPVVQVPPLDEAERREVAVRFLAAYAKALDTEHLDRLAAAPSTGNPRFLRVVLDELRQHGDHFTLGATIDRLCAAPTVDDLLELVLARYEADFERDRPGLTRDAMTALWAARRGLSEAELLLLLGADGDPLPQAVWSPLHLAAEQGIVSRGGLLGLAHDDLRRAVADRYLATDEDRRAAHARVAAFFAREPLGDRVVDELGWQQLAAGDLAGLAATLSDLAFTELAHRRDAAGLRRLWAALASSGDPALPTMPAAYAAVLADPAAHDGPDRQLVWGVARLLTDAGHPAAAAPLHRHLVEQARTAPAGRDEGPGGDARLRAALVNLGAAEWARGELAAAASALGEAADRCRSAGDDAMLAAAVGNLALVARDRGDLAAAERWSAEEEALCRRLDDEHGLQACLGNRAQLLRQLGRWDDALAALREQERICRDLADPAAVARALAGQATLLADRGDLPAALELAERHVASCREEGDARALVEALLNRTVMQVEAGVPAEEALAGAGEAEALARRVADGGLLARVLVARAHALGAAGRWAEVEPVAREAELTARAAGVTAQAALALGSLGTARRELGDVAGALAAHTDELAAAEAGGDPQAIAVARTNLGNVAIAQQRFDEALAHYAAAEPTFRQLDSVGSLLALVANRGQVHHALGRFPEALADLTDAASLAHRLGRLDAARQWGDAAVQLAYQLGDAARAERLWPVVADAARAAGDDAALQRALGEHALLLINRAQPAGAVGDATNVDQSLLDAAWSLLDEQEAVCRRSGDAVGLAACVGNRAIVLRYRGDLAGSLACLDEQLDVATRSGNAQGALFATANRGEVLGLLGRVPEALDALGRARATAAQYGLAPMVQQLDGMIAALRARN